MSQAWRSCHHPPQHPRQFCTIYTQQDSILKVFQLSYDDTLPSLVTIVWRTNKGQSRQRFAWIEADRHDTAAKVWTLRNRSGRSAESLEWSNYFEDFDLI